jgi:biotin-dependent carboxylase-like uncharacterized protein
MTAGSSDAHGSADDAAGLQGVQPRGRPEQRAGGPSVHEPYAVLEVLDAGPLTLVEDLGRAGLASLGVGRSGAADRRSHALGARLLGQDPRLASLEVTLGGLAVRAHGSVTAVLTGAPCDATLDGSLVGHAAPFLLRDGQTLRLGRPRSGLRTYLSVRGGVAVPPVLGSRSTDVLSGIGPPPLTAGDRVPVGEPSGHPHVDIAPVRPPDPGAVTLRATVGPRAGWLASLDALTATVWTVSEQSDRVGVRLVGPGLERHPSTRTAELPSEGVVRGAVQVPPGGEPVVFLSDHPVTGGYPVVAVVVEADIDLAAQVVPGQELLFRLHRG